MGASHLELTQSLADAFNELADEAQGLNDRRIVLEHKLRFAHEQLQYLADKYAPATPEITEALAHLQLPPHNTSIDENSSVPLPRKGSPKSQHQVALVIRDGRRVASQLASLGEASKTTGSTRDAYSHTSGEEKSSMSTALEQDFTVQGKRGNLDCPFQPPPLVASGERHEADDHEKNMPPDTTPHHSADPICAAMYEEATSQTTGAQDANGSKCPIRFLDQHSAEEIAHYVETHKHELPRSHEVCLRRYQHNEDQIRKLDNKYGSMINMIEDLGQLHQSMLPESQQGQPRRPSEVDKVSNERVKDWARAITETTGSAADEVVEENAESDRESRFDRPMKEVRVGESPSRPWGISVPVFDSHDDDQVPFSPPPAPVRMPSPSRSAKTPAKKCPFDHTKMQAMAAGMASHQRPTSPTTRTPHPPAPHTPSPAKESVPQPTPLAQPAFISPDSVKATSGTPQMVFNGPVFIGYPVEQAMQIMSQYRPSHP
ncbi:uncharacterized protein F5Z01DRAFT_443048 [Emericellopsis atlantica]|uniref:Uncharacterized protein n=1 Tax=Emericellopsis atlantica TaxID=2614577 RepID=A0A9P7ZRH7_9HYPO|nr:uncharacterized protein F5Z01DRAFT_443048 [Emericellopsis atlantica]KAG9256974.1 hypothetical protein F5Z01DRAFT_443048 [Emericellopsis atlantica]